MTHNYKYRNWLVPYVSMLMAVLFSVGLTVSALAAPALRANGKIAFTSNRDGNSEIYVMNADGTNQIRLTNNIVNDYQPSWSPDGRKVAFVSQSKRGGYAIFVMTASGSNKVEITPISGTWAFPSWSPPS